MAIFIISTFMTVHVIHNIPTSRRRMQQGMITWTMDSKHLTGDAADFISKSRGYVWPEFFTALQQIGAEVGLYPCPGGKELCHLQDRP